MSVEATACTRYSLELHRSIVCYLHKLTMHAGEVQDSVHRHWNVHSLCQALQVE